MVLKVRFLREVSRSVLIDMSIEGISQIRCNDRVKNVRD
jgi:hypothetical protein